MLEPSQAFEKQSCLRSSHVVGVEVFLSIFERRPLTQEKTPPKKKKKKKEKMSSRNLFPYLVKLFRCQQCPPSLISFFEVLLIPLSELGGGLLLYHRNRRTSLCCLQVGATAQPFFCLVPRALFLCASLLSRFRLNCCKR